MLTNSGRRLAWPGGAATAGLTVVAAILGGVLIGVASRDTRDASGQNASQAQMQQALRNTIDTSAARLMFVVTQTSEFAAKSSDQISIVFSDRSWADVNVAPTPIFGEDILQEFSFSAADFDTRNTLTFARVVRDRAFLSARYIRVINHGSQGWGGGTLTISVDGKPFLEQPMRPRKGDPTEGLKDCNRLKWRNRTYWEMELERTRRKAYAP